MRGYTGFATNWRCQSLHIHLGLPLWIDLFFTTRAPLNPWTMHRSDLAVIFPLPDRALYHHYCLHDYPLADLIRLRSYRLPA
jgi:hypothetical protein